MNRLIKYSILFFVMSVLLIFSGCQNYDYSAMEEYCYKINSVIKDIDFHTAEIKEGKIVLYDQKNAEIQQITFKDYENDKRIISVRKDGDIVYFIISGAVDDEQGIVFINDDSNSMLDGIKRLERIGGNSYRYSTSE